MDQQQKELWERIEDVRPTMMTTLEEDGTLRARPMWTQGDSFDGSLWFFTADDAPKAEELEQNPQVCLAYGKPDGDLFVSVSGRATIIGNCRCSMRPSHSYGLVSSVRQRIECCGSSSPNAETSSRCAVMPPNSSILSHRRRSNRVTTTP